MELLTWAQSALGLAAPLGGLPKSRSTASFESAGMSITFKARAAAARALRRPRVGTTLGATGATCVLAPRAARECARR
jgi:hypothetical protein